MEKTDYEEKEVPSNLLSSEVAVDLQKSADPTPDANTNNPLITSEEEKSFFEEKISSKNADSFELEKRPEKNECESGSSEVYNNPFANFVQSNKAKADSLDTATKLLVEDLDKFAQSQKEDSELATQLRVEDKNENYPSEEVPERERLEQEKLKRQIFIILVCVNAIAFLGSFSYWMQSGVLPYLTRKLGVNPQMFGYMQSTFALYQLVGSPIFGRFGDVFGCRICLVTSEIASAFAYGSLAFATNIGILFLSRVPAIFMHNLQGSYMIITDCTLPAQRANYLGKLGVSHGVGMIVGSFVGGLITEKFGDSATAIFAACGNLLCAIIVCVFIPDDTKAIRRKLESITSTPPEQTVGASLGLKELFNIFKIKIIRYLLFIKILSAFPFALLYSMFSMAIMDFYKEGPRVNGIILAYLGSLSILIQGVLIGLLTSRFLDPTLVKLAVFLNTGGFLFLIVAENVYLLCLTLLPMAIGGTVSHIIITAAITKAVPIEDTGSALGLTLSFHALIRSIAPTLGGLIFTVAGWPFFGVIGYGIHLFLSVFIVLLGKDSFESK